MKGKKQSDRNRECREIETATHLIHLTAVQFIPAWERETKTKSIRLLSMKKRVVHIKAI